MATNKEALEEKLKVLGDKIIQYYRVIAQRYMRKRDHAYNTNSTDTLGGRNITEFLEEVNSPYERHVHAAGDPHKITPDQLNVFSRGQFDDLLSRYFLGGGFPITRYGSLDPHPINVLGDGHGLDLIRGGNDFDERRRVRIHGCIEDDEAARFLRNTTDGRTRQVSYGHVKKATYDPGKVVQANQPYTFPAGRKVAYLYRGGNNALSGRLASPTGNHEDQPNFIAITSGQLDNAYHGYVTLEASYKELLLNSEIVIGPDTVYLISIVDPLAWSKPGTEPKLAYYTIPRDLFTGDASNRVTPTPVKFDWQVGVSGTRFKGFDLTEYSLATKMTSTTKEETALFNVGDTGIRGGHVIPGQEEKIVTYSAFNKEGTILRTMLTFPCELRDDKSGFQLAIIQVNLDFEVQSRNITLGPKNKTIEASYDGVKIVLSDGVVFTTAPTLFCDNRYLVGYSWDEYGNGVAYRLDNSPTGGEFFYVVSTNPYSFEMLSASNITKIPESNAYTLSGDIRICNYPRGIVPVGKNRFVSGVSLGPDITTEAVFYDTDPKKTYSAPLADGSVSSVFPAATNPNNVGDLKMTRAVARLSLNIDGDNYHLGQLYGCDSMPIGRESLNEGDQSTWSDPVRFDLNSFTPLQKKVTGVRTSIEMVRPFADRDLTFMGVGFIDVRDKDAALKFFVGNTTYENGVVSYKDIQETLIEIPASELLGECTAVESDMIGVDTGKLITERQYNGWLVTWIPSIVGRHYADRVKSFAFSFWLYEDAGVFKIESFRSFTFNYEIDAPRLAHIPGVGVGISYPALMGAGLRVNIHASNRDNLKTWGKPIATHYLLSGAFSTQWEISIPDTQPLVMNGYHFKLDPYLVNLKSITNDPANKTFYLYIHIENNVPRYELTLTDREETSVDMYIGKVVTGSESVTSFLVEKVTRLDNYRLSKVPVGSAIPVVVGPPDRTDNKVSWT